MVRLILLEDPGTDEALAEVRGYLDASKNLGTYEHAVVKMINNGSGRKEDVTSALDAFETKYAALHPKLESIDFVGHGAPGLLMVGGTSAKSAQVPTIGQCREWAQIDSDVNKVQTLSPLCKRLRKWREANWLAPSFELRMLGCNTAVDPGIVPMISLSMVHDGAVLIHFLASFLDVPVSGALAYLSPLNFKDGVFKSDVPLLRRCTTNASNGRVTFDPETVNTGPTDVDESTDAPPLSLTQIALRAADIRVVRRLEMNPVEQQGLPPMTYKLSPLFEPFEDTARPLKAMRPLVVRDLTIATPYEEIDIVEQGKALLIRKNGRLYRAKPKRSAKGSVQQKVAKFIEEWDGEKPQWASDSIRKKQYQ
jgi:hypothetical protein